MCESSKKGLSKEEKLEIQEQVNKLLEEKENNEHKGRNYNIFTLFRAEHKETDMTRILADFLDPDGSHGQVKSFLKLFIEEVLGIKRPNLSDAVTKVSSEYLTKDGKRIDIVIEVEDFGIIPIEAKICAKLGYKQLENYYNEAVSKNGPNEAVVYYLTLDGQQADDWGLGEKTKKSRDAIKPISWKCIGSWLAKCQKILKENYKEEYKEEGVAPVSEIMRQFQEDIKRWCGENEEMKALDKVFNSEDRQTFALEIWENHDKKTPADIKSWEHTVWEYVEKKRNHVLQDFLKAVDEHVKGLGVEVDDHAETYSRYILGETVLENGMEKGKKCSIVIDFEPCKTLTKITISLLNFPTRKTTTTT